MCDFARLIRVRYIQVLLFHEPFRVCNVVVQMRDAAIKFATSLCYGLTHLLCDYAREIVLALRENARQSCHLLESLREKIFLVCVIEAEALV